MDFIIINNMIFNKSVIRNIHATRIADTLYEIVVETDDQDYCPQTCTSEEYANETIKKIFTQLNTVNIVDGFKVEVNKE